MTQDGQVGALVRARQQVVHHAAEVVAVGLFGDGVAEGVRELVQPAGVALGHTLVT